MEKKCSILNYLPDNLKQLEIYKKIDDLYCYSSYDIQKNEVQNYLDTLELSLIFREKINPSKLLINWFSELKWDETENADWERSFIFEENTLNFNEYNYEDSLSNVYGKLINSKNRSFNLEGFQFWVPSFKPYIGTNLIQRKMLEVLDLNLGQYKYEFYKIQFFIKNDIYDAYIQNNEFKLEISKQLIDDALSDPTSKIFMKVHYYNGLRSALEIKNLGYIDKDEIKLYDIEIGNISFFNIDFDKPIIEIIGRVKTNERPYTQLSGIIDWYENNLPINSYDILLEEFPGEEKVQALIEASLEYKNIESKLFTIKDNLCVSRMGLSDGSRLDSEKVSDIYGNDFMGVKICFQRYDSRLLNFEKDFNFDKIINSSASDIISIWCNSLLSESLWLDRGIPENKYNGDGELVEEFRICPQFIRQTYETQRSQFNQLLPAFNFSPDFWSASTIWEDTFNWKGVIIDTLITKTIGPDKNINWESFKWDDGLNWSSFIRLGKVITDNFNYENNIKWIDENWRSDLNWGTIKVDGEYKSRIPHENITITWEKNKNWSSNYIWAGKVNQYHYNKPYTGELPIVEPNQVDWGWADTGIDKYPIDAKSEISLFKVKVNKTKSCETDDGYGRIMDGKFTLVDGNLTSDCDLQDGNLLYEDLEYEPYLNNEYKNMLLSNSAFISEEWYISGNFNSGRPYSEESVKTSIDSVTKFESYSKHSIEMIFGEENTIVKNIIISQDSKLDDELYLSGDVQDGIRPIVNINYHKKLLKYNNGVLYTKHESEFMPQENNKVNRNVILSQDAKFGEKLYLSGIALDLSIYIANTYTKKLIYQPQIRIESEHKTLWVNNPLETNTYHKNILSEDSRFTFNHLGGDNISTIYERNYESKINLNNNSFKVYRNNSEFIYANNLSENTDKNILLDEDSQIGINNLSGEEV